MPPIHPLLLVALGGAAGSVTRYLVAGLLNPPRTALVPGDSPWSLFPIGTFAVNLIGCALIGLIAGWLGVGLASATSSPATSLPNPAWRLLLITGVLGGFTTFSAFSMETVFLLRAGAVLPASIYVVGSTVLGITLAWAGYALTVRT